MAARKDFDKPLDSTQTTVQEFAENFTRAVLVGSSVAIPLSIAEHIGNAYQLNLSAVPTNLKPAFQLLRTSMLAASLKGGLIIHSKKLETKLDQQYARNEELSKARNNTAATGIATGIIGLFEGLFLTPFANKKTLHSAAAGNNEYASAFELKSTSEKLKFYTGGTSLRTVSGMMTIGCYLTVTPLLEEKLKAFFPPNAFGKPAELIAPTMTGMLCYYLSSPFDFIQKQQLLSFIQTKQFPSTSDILAKEGITSLTRGAPIHSLRSGAAFLIFTEVNKYFDQYIQPAFHSPKEKVNQAPHAVMFKPQALQPVATVKEWEPSNEHADRFDPFSR